MTPRTVILASASPRRRALLEALGLSCRTEPAAVDETPRDGEPAAAFAERAARDKAEAVAERHPSAVVLAADTVVEVDGTILGKPADAADARRMLLLLAGREHRVHTGVALTADRRRASVVDTAGVRFGPVDERTLAWYVATPEPYDKAGAYAVQGRAGLFVRSVSGSPHTVVGLPLHVLPDLFRRCRIELLDLLLPPPG